MAYITQADIEARLSATVVAQILDDNNDGTADAAPVARVIADATSYFEGFARPVYDLTALRAAPPAEAKRLVLDVAVAYLAMRHSEYVRLDGTALLTVVRAELKDLRMGITRLDVVTTPEPAANEGGEVRSGDVNNPTPPDRFFANGTGDF